MTRRTLLVPLFVAAFILAPSELSGKIEASPALEPPEQAQGLPLRLDRYEPVAGLLSVVAPAAPTV